MAETYLVFFSVPGLRPGDIDPRVTPTLYEWANRGALTELTPTFPCVTSCVQASMWTGTGPSEHGVIANGFYHRDRREVEFWVGQNDLVQGEQVWDALSAGRSDLTSAVWHAQNIKGAGADFIVTPAPIHEADGTTKLWCYSKPDGLYEEMLGAVGHFPLQHYWGPLANIKSTRWILDAAQWLIQRQAPNFHWIYIPHLDYAGQKLGPDSDEAKAALAELDQELARFAGRIAESKTGNKTTYLVAGEYAMTKVSEVVYPNRILREAGLLSTLERDGGECIDFENSTAFAMVDHQFAHIFVNDRKPSTKEAIRDVFRNVSGVADVYVNGVGNGGGLNHPRGGEVILVSKDTHWFAYYWWVDDVRAPAFARTVDIHRKPGYDPVELFFDPATKSIPLTPELVRGSHGVPATDQRHRAALICSAPSSAIDAGQGYRDIDLKRITLELLGVS